MDTWGIIILVAFLILYFVTKKKYPALLFLAGVGLGIVAGALGSYLIVMNLLP